MCPKHTKKQVSTQFFRPQGHLQFLYPVPSFVCPCISLLKEKFLATKKQLLFAFYIIQTRKEAQKKLTNQKKMEFHIHVCFQCATLPSLH